VDTKRSSYAVLYAAVLGLVCALALTAVNRATEERKAANARAEEVRNILAVLDVPFATGATSSDLLELYRENVSEVDRGDVTFFVYDHPEEGLLYATRFEGAGLWGPMEALLSLRDDMRTIYEVSFYRHEETPGLGGEISSYWFEDQFRGKSIVDESGSPGIEIVPAGAEGISEVDAISGATMTGDRVEAMLNGAIDRIVSAGEAADRTDDIRSRSGSGADGQD
jgi:Na+-transporting NADH:ubiquinone oxidoreductase subunit C